MVKIVVLGMRSVSFPFAQAVEHLRSRLPSDVRVVVPKSLSEQDVIEEATDADIIIGGPSRKVVEAARSLKLIEQLYHGPEVVTMDPGYARYLKGREIKLGRTVPSSVTIAEFVIMQLVAVTRRVVAMHNRLAYEGDWSRNIFRQGFWESKGGIIELRGKTLGILGIGYIGSEVARRAKAFGMRVLAVRRFPSEEFRLRLGIDWLGGPAEVEYLLAKSDFVVVALPLTSETAGLINEEAFKKMKNGVYIVNIARGPIIDQKALYESLRSGRVAGAAVDVWYNESAKEGTPTYPSDYPVHQFNTLMTPHNQETEDIYDWCMLNLVSDLQRFLRGEPIEDMVRASFGEMPFYNPGLRPQR